MTPRVELNEEHGTYELGDDVDGVFIAFATVPKTTVDSRVSTVLGNQGNTAPAETPAAAPAETTGDYTDNGDGTYTRQSDGATGRFGPSGFTADTQA